MGRIEYLEEILVDMDETMRILGLKKSQVNRLRKKGLLGRRKIPGHRTSFIPFKDIEIFLAISDSTTPEVKEMRMKIEELERKVAWLMDNSPTPPEYYRRGREIIEGNHPGIFS